MNLLARHKIAIPFLLGIILIFIISACEKEGNQTLQQYEVGKVYKASALLSFSFTSVNDYRCPSNVICIWGGDVDIQLQISDLFGTLETTFTLSNVRNKPLFLKNYYWNIREVFPYPDGTNQSEKKYIEMDYSLKPF